jgi:hypothetical protein
MMIVSNLIAATLASTAPQAAVPAPAVDHSKMDHSKMDHSNGSRQVTCGFVDEDGLLQGRLFLLREDERQARKLSLHCGHATAPLSERA